MEGVQRGQSRNFKVICSTGLHTLDIDSGCPDKDCPEVIASAITKGYPKNICGISSVFDNTLIM